MDVNIAVEETQLNSWKMRTASDLARPLLLITAFTVSACGKGTADPSANTVEMSTVPIQRMGQVWIDQQNDGLLGTTIQADFGLLNRPLGYEQTIETVVPTLDSCSTDAISEALLGAAFIIEPDSTLEAVPISAGEALVFSSPAGTWHTVLQDSEPGDFGYFDRTARPPDDLALDVPGDSFPSFTDMPVANITPLGTITPEAFAILTSDTVFRWQPAPAEADTVIVIVINVFDESADQVSRIFFCVAKDDGELSLRDAADTELSALIDQDVTLTRRDAGRLGYTARQTEDALLVVTHSVPESDPQP